MNELQWYEKMKHDFKQVGVITIDFTFEYLLSKRKEFKSFGDTKILFECPCGNRYERSYNNAMKKDRPRICPSCSLKAKGERRRKKDPELRAFCLLKGVELISHSYNSLKSDYLLRVKCKCGQVIDTTYSSMRSSVDNTLLGRYACKSCRAKVVRDLFRVPFNEVREVYDKEGCILLSSEEEYGNVYSVLRFVAKCGHKHEMPLRQFRKSKYKLCEECTKRICAGEKAYNWKGGYEYGRPDQSGWKAKVLERDGYVCAICSSKELLNTHHIDGYNWCVDKRSDINNGITLCKECHTDFHKEYGFGNNTSQQFKKWRADRLGCSQLESRRIKQ